MEKIKQKKQQQMSVTIPQTSIIELQALITADADSITELKDNLDALGQPNASIALTTINHETGVSPFFAACAIGAVGTSPKSQYVQLMLLYGANVSKVGDKKGNTPLHIAALGLRAAICVLLCRYGSSLSALNNERRTAMHLALERTDTKDNAELYFRSITTAKLLSAIRHESRKEPYGGDDVGELVVAVQCGDATRVEKLLRKSPQLINQRITQQIRWTAVHLAVALMNVSVLQKLANAPGVQMSLCDEDNWTPLHWVVASSVVTPELDCQCLEMLKILESAGPIQYWTRVVNSKFIRESLIGSCFVTELAPDWQGMTEEKKQFAFFFNKAEVSEEHGVERYQVSMWYDGNPAEDVIGMFEPNNRRKLTFRRRGNYEIILAEKLRNVFYDDKNGVISMESSTPNLDSSAYSWAKTQPEKDWALHVVPTMLNATEIPANKNNIYIAGSAKGKIEFTFSRLEKMSATTEVYAIDVAANPGRWMLSVMRLHLEMAGTRFFETKLVFKLEGKIQEQFTCDITTLSVKRDGVTSLVTDLADGPTVLHWTAAHGMTSWVQMLLNKGDCNPFDAGNDGKSPYMLSLVRLKEAEDDMKDVKAQLENVQEQTKNDAASASPAEQEKDQKNIKALNVRLNNCSI